MKYFATVTLAAALCFSASAALSAADEIGKNTANVEFRRLPHDFEKLPALEPQKWNFNFRPYGKEAAEVLWSDPNSIRQIAAGEKSSSGQIITGIYASCDAEGLDILIFATMPQTISGALEKGTKEPGVSLETYVLPGDADDPQIINYHPFGFSSNQPYLEWSLSWMKWDRDTRPVISEIVFDVRRVTNGLVIRMHYPWLPFFDRLPVFSEKEDNFWRLAMLRWDGKAVTWGGVVHQQVQLGYLRMPAFTQEQKTQILKSVLLKIWNRYQNIKSDRRISPNFITGRDDFYRNSQKDLPKSYMNVNEDFGFQDAWLLQAIKDRDALGAGIADFEKLPPAEQDAFYKKNAALLYNFDYDIEEAYADYLNKKIMKR